MVVRGPIASLSRLAIKREEQARTIVLRVAATPSAVFSHALTSVKNTESPVWPHPPPTPFDKIYRKVCWAAGASRRLTDRLPEPNLLTARNRLANHQELEVLLYDDVPPDTKDSNGNSLLLLASQQVRSFFMLLPSPTRPQRLTDAVTLFIGIIPVDFGVLDSFGRKLKTVYLLFLVSFGP